MVKFFKNNWLIMVLAMATMFLIAGKIYLTLNPEGKKVETQSWNGIVPGSSSVNDVSSQIGDPVSSSDQNGSVVLEYKSDVGDLKHKVYAQNNTVGLVKEQIWGKEKLEDYQAKYNLPEGEYFGDYQESGYKVYAYPAQGLAVIAAPDDGFVLEKWYFEPLSLQEFLASWGEGLTLEEQGGF